MYKLQNYVTLYMIESNVTKLYFVAMGCIKDPTLMLKH